MRYMNVSGLRLEIGAFHPHLYYNERIGALQVILCDTSVKWVTVSPLFDVMVVNNPAKKKGMFAGFVFWRVNDMLRHQGYQRSSISLEHLVERFERHHRQHFPQVKVYDGYKERLLAVAHKHQFVWHLSK